MPFFKYTAMRPDGNLVSGEGDFSTLEEMFLNLQREGLLLLEYKRKKIPTIAITRVKNKDLAEFLHQLSIMLRSGLPLLTILDELEKEIKGTGLKNIIKKVKTGLLSGETLSQTVSKIKVFPPIVVTLIQIGENTGTLDKTLEEASKHLYKVEEIKGNIKRALIYPFFVLFAMLGALGFWFFFVLPQILKVFQEMNIKLPLPTILLIKVVNFLLKIKFYIPLFLIFAAMLFLFLYKHKSTQVYTDKMLLKVPIWGRIKRLNFLAFFFEHFALMLNSGLDLLRLLRLLQESFHRIYYKKIVKKIEDTILQGESISTAFRNEPIFRPIDMRMVSVGESTGRLPEQMQMLADFYMQEVRNLVDSLTKILEPLVLFIAGIIFLIIIIALIGPIYELITQIGKQ